MAISPAVSMDTLRKQMHRRAFLYDNPGDYLAGMEDTLTALRVSGQLVPDEPRRDDHHAQPEHRLSS